MGMIISIAEANDSRIEEYTRLKDITLRKRLEPARGIFLGESFNVIQRAIEQGYQILSALSSPHWLPKLQQLLEQELTATELQSLPIYLAEEKVLENITGFHLHRGAIAIFARPELPDVAEILKTSRRIAILENLVDHKNVGAAIRSAAAMNYDAVLVSPRCADPLYRRSIRVSMGTVFQIPWSRLENWPDPQLFHDFGFITVALTLNDKAISLPDFTTWMRQPQNPDSPVNRLYPDLSSRGFDSPPKIALVLGSEGPGLEDSTQKHCDLSLKIPMNPLVDSLNVAAATAVACYATSHL